MVLMSLLPGRSGDAGVGDGLVDMGDGVGGWTGRVASRARHPL